MIGRWLFFVSINHKNSQKLYFNFSESFFGVAAAPPSPLQTICLCAMKEWSGRVNNSSNKNFRVLLGLPLFIKYPMYDKYTEAPSRFNMPTVFDEVSRLQHYFCLFVNILDQ